MRLYSIAFVTICSVRRKILNMFEKLWRIKVSFIIGDNAFLYVDFAKAVDTIDQSKLLTCLTDRGIGGKLLRILKSMYSNLHTCVQSSAHFTSSSQVTSAHVRAAS